jgi:thiol-disulfide isomerase/thioredoxin
MRQIPVLLATLMAFQACGAGSPTPDSAPEFTRQKQTDWINSAPLKLAQLRGEVVLVEFWTFGCINCLRTLPWLKAMHARYGDQGLHIVGVHAPEFAHERDAAQVHEAVRRLGIEYPVMLDNDFAYWRAFNNRYWPAFYLIGRDGHVAAAAVGELHEGTARGDEFEERIRKLTTSG